MQSVSLACRLFVTAPIEPDHLISIQIDTVYTSGAIGFLLVRFAIFSHRVCIDCNSPFVPARSRNSHFTAHNWKVSVNYRLCVFCLWHKQFKLIQARMPDTWNSNGHRLRHQPRSNSGMRTKKRSKQKHERAHSIYIFLVRSNAKVVVDRVPSGCSERVKKEEMDFRARKNGIHTAQGGKNAVYRA